MTSGEFLIRKRLNLRLAEVFSYRRNMKISVIVPFWNSEQWLGRCCESLLKQDGDFEFILVDDNSTDRSFPIALAYCAKDPRFILLNNVYRKGVSGARNTGLAWAEGEWITFLDADDEYLDDAYETFMRVIKADPRANIHQMNHIRYYSSLGKTTMKFINPRGVYSSKKMPEAWFGVWNKLYRRDLVKDIRFDESLQYGEDGLFNLHALAQDDYIHHTSKGLVAVKHNFINPESLSKKKSMTDLLKQVHAYEEFMLKSRSPSIRLAVCEDLSRLWGSYSFRKVVEEL